MKQNQEKTFKYTVKEQQNISQQNGITFSLKYDLK